MAISNNPTVSGSSIASSEPLKSEGGWSVITKFSSKFIMTIYEVNDKESEFRFNNRDKDIYKLLLNNANENML